MGISLGVYGAGLDNPDGSEAWAEYTETGVTIYNSWEDHGQGADMGTLATAHRALMPLGIKPEQIKMVMNDTSKTPPSGPAGGSRSQVMTGNAIKIACEELLKGIQKPDGTYRTYQEQVEAGLPTRFVGKYNTPAGYNGCDLETGQGAPFTTYMYAAFLSEVEVDVNTGKTKVLGMTGIFDVGSIANKLVVDGQVYGGMVQGIGLALSDDFEYLDKHIDLISCGLPYPLDVPDKLVAEYVETPREHGPFGASGVGEAPLTSPHAAIINAIYDACGVRITKLPALPEKVLAGLKAKQQQ